MVIDRLENLEKYASLNPLFPKVVEFLKNTDLASHEAGKVFIQDKDLFANFTTAKGKKADEATLETHIEMIHIQIPINTCETMGYIPACKLPQVEYNAEKDITKYPGVASESYIKVQPGMFAIFFPEDGHAPCISDEAEIQKVIFKVKVAK